MPPHIRPETRHQAILDYLNKHGESTCRQLCEALGLSKGPITGFIRTLKAKNEVASREQKDGRASVPHYSALVVVTRPDDVDKPKTFGLPVKTHKGSERSHPLANQGGQGALRSRVFVGSCADWV